MRCALVCLRRFARPLLSPHSHPHSRRLYTSRQSKMNVTKDNLAVAVAEIKPLLETAAFVAIDLEMTGIHLPGVLVERMDDTTEQRYAKMKSVAEHYKIIQAGVCLFHRDDAASQPDAPVYVARPYNFYLFPEDGAVNMEASAIAFNKTHGMDFNKWIYEGVPYLTTEGVLQLREKFYAGEKWAAEEARVARLNGHMVDDSAAAATLPQEKKEEKKKAITLERESDIAFVDGVKAQITAWLSTRSAEDHELLLPDCNSFLRLAVRQWMEAVPAGDAALAGAERDNVFLETRPIADQRWKSSFVVCHYTAQERELLAAAAAVTKRAEYERKLGFKAVWDALTGARRPLVVHNGFFDLLFLWSHFEAATLPATLPEFKAELAARFPAGIFDTKFLSASRQFCFPFEHWANLAAQVGAKHSPSALVRIEQAAALNVPPAARGKSRFMETHLEKLWLAIKKEGETRVALANGVAPAAAPAGPAGTPNPPPPFGAIKVDLAPGFNKYALIGQPGGDASAAHEAGYDAYMTAMVFAHFAAEAQYEELMAAIALASSSSSSLAPSVWRGRVPLFRHLMALKPNLDGASGLPLSDSLVDSSSSVYIMRGFPTEYKNDDITRLFDGYVSAKRKLEDSSPSSTAMVDVGEEAASLQQPSAVTVTAAPKITWIDNTSVFLSVPAADTAKLAAFLVQLKAEQAAPDSAIPSTIEIALFASPASA